jgi:hypothetical protein
MRPLAVAAFAVLASPSHAAGQARPASFPGAEYSRDEFNGTETWLTWIRQGGDEMGRSLWLGVMKFRSRDGHDSYGVVVRLNRRGPTFLDGQSEWLIDDSTIVQETTPSSRQLRDSRVLETASWRVDGTFICRLSSGKRVRARFRGRENSPALMLYRDELQRIRPYCDDASRSSPLPDSQPASRPGNLSNQVDSLRRSEADTSPTRELLIRGFSGSPWGSSVAAIVAKMGAPSEKSEDSAGTYLSYKTDLLGHDALTTYVVSKRNGLVKGEYVVSYGPGTGCERLFDDLVDAIRAKYPSIKAEETKYNNSSLDFCDGVMIGKAARITYWKDPGQPSALIGVILQAGDSFVRVGYESPSSHAWSQARKKSDDRF